MKLNLFLKLQCVDATADWSMAWLKMSEADKALFYKKGKTKEDLDQLAELRTKYATGRITVKFSAPIKIGGIVTDFVATSLNLAKRTGAVPGKPLPESVADMLLDASLTLFDSEDGKRVYLTEDCVEFGLHLSAK